MGSTALAPGSSDLAFDPARHSCKVQMCCTQEGFDIGRGMGLCGWFEVDQVLVCLHDVPAFFLCL